MIMCRVPSPLGLSGVDLACGPQVPSSPITLMAILFTHQANNTFFQETSDGIRIDGAMNIWLVCKVVLHQEMLYKLGGCILDMVGIILRLHRWSVFNEQEVHLGEGQPKRTFL